MLKLPALMLDVVQRILERYLRIGLGAYIFRDYRLYSLKIQEIKRIRQFVQKCGDICLVYIWFSVFKSKLHLPQLFGILDWGIFIKILISDPAFAVVLEFF